MRCLVLLALALSTLAHASDGSPLLYWGSVERADQFQERGRYRVTEGDLMAQEGMKRSAYHRYRRTSLRRLYDTFGGDGTYVELAERSSIVPPGSDFETVWRFNPERARTRSGFTTIHQALRVTQKVVVVADRPTDLTPHPLAGALVVVDRGGNILAQDRVDSRDFELRPDPRGFEFILSPASATRLRDQLRHDRRDIDGLGLTLRAPGATITLRAPTIGAAVRYLGFPPEAPSERYVILKLPDAAVSCARRLGVPPERWPYGIGQP